MGVENDKKDFDLAYVTQDITLFNVSQCDKSLSKGFIPINTWQQRAATPLKPTKGHRLQVKIYRR